MKPTKLKVLAGLLLAACTAFISLQMAPPPPGYPTYDQHTFERFPPIATQIWVQKLATPKTDSSNVVMWIKYISDDALPPVIKVYYNGDIVAFHDDGAEMDSVSHDGIYAAYVKENIPAFITRVTNLQNSLADQGTFTTFTGHVGTVHTVMPTFDITNFNNYQKVGFSAKLLSGSDCSTAILPQNSLFITDLSVVEDPSRTYNVAVDTGNPVGVWTFGQMMKNIVNDTTKNATRNFLKNWVKSYFTGRTINGQFVDRRDAIFTYLITPWLVKANKYNPIASSYSVTDSLDAYFNRTPEDSILQYAPFKLLAIVNRFDLGGSSYYGNGLSLAGETRFIYTLIAPISYTPSTSIYTINKGTIPINTANNSNEDDSLIDWKGMNVILEYGNVQTNACDMQAFAQSWLNLSADTLGTSTFNDDLEAITRTVTKAGMAPGRVNGSALMRLRSNERIFFPALVSFKFDTTWSQSDWQLSQFELESVTHQLIPVPVPNTPQLNASKQTNMVSIAANPITMDPSSSAALINWVFANTIRVLTGSHLMPDRYIINSDTLLLAGTADMSNEQGHYWDLNWDATGMPSYPGIPTGPGTTNADSQYIQECRLLRNQISINTCQGCHGGENKTLFTHIRPVGYGVSENYWGTIPESETGKVDLRFVQNTGQSFFNATLSPVYSMISNVPDYNTVHTVVTVPYVSAFLTGRAYHGGSDFSDDRTSDDASDAGLNGNFWVYDPINNNDGTTDNSQPQLDRTFAYNDLLMRKQKLCNFINFACPGATSSNIIGIVFAVGIIPASE